MSIKATYRELGQTRPVEPATV